MSKYKDMVKSKMPERKAGSITGMGVRGQVSGLVHRNKSDGPTHVARPINSLTDPSTFAPPPTRRGTGLAPAPQPTNEKRSVLAAPSKYQDPRGPKVAPPPKVSSSQQPQQQQQIEYHRQDSGLSAGSGSGSLGGSSMQQAFGEQEEEEVPRGPYRVNTTGLSTDHLPKPPGRRDGADGRSPPPVPPPPSYNTALSHPQQPPPTVATKPSLPPRLPARTNAGSTPPPPPPPQTSRPAAVASSNSFLNQNAIAKLGNAGVSVPGLGIDSGNSVSPSPPPPPRQPSTGGAGAVHLGELQNRFSNRNTSASSEPSPGGGTTWAQKQAALNTASMLRKDPASVSAADAKAAAGVAGNFHQRHGEQAANLNQKYGVADRVGSLVGGVSPNQGSRPGSAPGSPVPGLAGKKKPPPPPPKKKPGLGGGAAPAPVLSREDEDVPPPVPLATRPTF